MNISNRRLSIPQIQSHLSTLTQTQDPTQLLTHLQAIRSLVSDQFALLVLTQPILQKQLSLMDILLGMVFKVSPEADDLILEIVKLLIEYGSFTNNSQKQLFSQVAQDYAKQKADILHLKTLNTLIELMFTSNSITKWPQRFFCMDGKSEIKVIKATCPWPFTNGLTLAAWMYIEEKHPKSVLMNLTIGNTSNISITLNNGCLEYHSSFKHYDQQILQLEEVPLRQWIFIQIEIVQKMSQQYVLKIQVDQVELDELKINFPHLTGSYQFEFSFFQNFRGYISSLILFREQISFDLQNIRQGLQNENQLNKVHKMIETEFHQIYIFFTPLRFGDQLYDVVQGNHGDIIGEVVAYTNEIATRKWRNLFSLMNILPLFHNLKHINHEDGSDYLNKLLSNLVIIFTQKTDSQIEAKQIDFFSVISQFILEANNEYFNQETIHILFELNKCIIEKNLKEKMFTDMIWPLTKLKFNSSDLFEEFSQLIRMFYNQNPLTMTQQFNVQDIINQIYIQVGLDTEEFDKIKLKTYFNQIESILQILQIQNDPNKTYQQVNKNCLIQLIRSLSVKQSEKFLFYALKILQAVIELGENRYYMSAEEPLLIIVQLAIENLNPVVKSICLNIVQKITMGPLKAQISEIDLALYLHTEIDDKDQQVEELIQQLEASNKKNESPSLKNIIQQVEYVQKQMAEYHAKNQLYINQDDQILLRTAKTQQRRVWNQIFNQIGVWNASIGDFSMPPQNFTFKVGNNTCKTGVRPLLKLKRKFTRFDGLPIIVEEPYRRHSADLNAKFNPHLKHVISPFKRKQIQDDITEEIQQDWMDNFVNFLKDFSFNNNHDNIQINQVQWIKTLSIRVGILELSEQKLKFIYLPDQSTSLYVRHKFPSSRPLIRQWELSQINFGSIRRFIQRKNCLSVETLDGQQLLFNFLKPPIKFLQELIEHQQALQLPHTAKMLSLMNCSNLETLQSRIRKTEKWLSGKISNLKYLMVLNKIANRSFKDLSQYPVTPWVIKRYHGEKLDLSNPEYYRDLSKPMGACGSPERSLAFHQKYYNSDLQIEGVPPFHYGSHYSNPGIVMHFLIRLQPFSRGAKELQSGKWDIPDRLFHSIKELYFNSINEMSDVRELVPEAFVLPEMYLNLERFNFGQMQTGEIVDHVILPSYAPTAYDFVAIHRQALESEYASSQLNNWIDLIFGYKQKGKAAEQNLNQFYYLTYDDMINLDSIDDLTMRKSLELQIIHFGQTPSQLFTKPHPQKLDQNKQRIINQNGKLIQQKLKDKAPKEDTNPFKIVASIFQKEHITNAKFVKRQKIIFMSPYKEKRILILRKDGEVQIATFPDVNVEFQVERTFNLQITQDEQLLRNNPEVDQYVFDYLQKSQILIFGSSWYGKVDLYSISKEVKLGTYQTNPGRITKIKHDLAEQFVVIGCELGQLCVWKISGESMRCHQTYQDHVQQITDLDVNQDLRSIVSSGMDGRINLYNYYNSKYQRTYFHNSEIEQVKVVCCPIYGIVFVSQGSLFLMSINGERLKMIQLRKSIISGLDVIQDDQHNQLIYFMNQEQEIILVSSHNLQEVQSIKTGGDISKHSFLVFSPDQKSIAIGNREGFVNVLMQKQKD